MAATFEELKSKADALKSKRDQSLGVIKSIEDGWEQKYGTRDDKVLKEKLAGMEKERDELKADFDAKLQEAEQILAGACV